MFSLIRFSFYFTMSFFILSAPYNKEPLFNHLHELSSPYTTEIYKNIIAMAKQLKNSTIKSTSDLIEETIPKQVDKISSSLSSIAKDEFPKSKDIEKRNEFFKHQKNHHDHHNHEYTPDDKKLLRKILGG